MVFTSSKWNYIPAKWNIIATIFPSFKTVFLITWCALKAFDKNHAIYRSIEVPLEANWCIIIFFSSLSLYLSILLVFNQWPRQLNAWSYGWRPWNHHSRHKTDFSTHVLSQSQLILASRVSTTLTLWYCFLICSVQCHNPNVLNSKLSSAIYFCLFLFPWIIFKYLPLESLNLQVSSSSLFFISVWFFVVETYFLL